MTLETIVKTKFNGVIARGNHHADAGACCILEAVAVQKGLKWTDIPSAVRMFDIRPINDNFRNDELRTYWMLKLAEAIDGSLDWPKSRQHAFVTEVSIETVRQIIAEMPGVSDDIRQQCRIVKSLDDARVAAEAAASAAYAAASAAYAAASAAYAAYAAADAAVDAAARATRAAARAAARAATYAAKSDDVLVTACQIWIEAAKNSEEAK